MNNYNEIYGKVLRAINTVVPMFALPCEWVSPADVDINYYTHVDYEGDVQTYVNVRVGRHVYIEIMCRPRDYLAWRSLSLSFRSDGKEEGSFNPHMRRRIMVADADNEQEMKTLLNVAYNLYVAMSPM